VVWTSASDLGADHDILSVADDGGHFWVEVKSTTGSHGRFDWPRSEFEPTLRARERYVLYRVCEADADQIDLPGTPGVVEPRLE